MDWQPIDSAPKDGTVIWAYLFDSGIKQVRWWSAQDIMWAEDSDDPELWQEGWYEEPDFDEGWSPQYWLPLDALPEFPK